jgi:hypothetical protein
MGSGNATARTPAAEFRALDLTNAPLRPHRAALRLHPAAALAPEAARGAFPSLAPRAAFGLPRLSLLSELAFSGSVCRCDSDHLLAKWLSHRYRLLGRSKII